MIISLFCIIIITIFFIIIYIISKRICFLRKKKKYLENINKNYIELNDIKYNNDIKLKDIGNINYKDITFIEKDGKNIILGEGISSIVYLGNLENEKVALKLMKNNIIDKNLINEINIHKKLNHINILKYYGTIINEEDNEIYLVSEYCINGTLKSYLKKQDITFKEKMNILLQIIYGLDYLHNRSPPIIHRDLKTDNILLNNVFCVKISDFGLSKMNINNLNITMGMKCI